MHENLALFWIQFFPFSLTVDSEGSNESTGHAKNRMMRLFNLISILSVIQLREFSCWALLSSFRKKPLVMPLNDKEVQSNRRLFLAEQSKRLLLISSLLSTGSFPSPGIAATKTEESSSTPSGSSRKIIKLFSGVQFSDARVGKGPRVGKNDFILLHLRALRYDGSILFDTKIDGDQSPIQYQLGSVEQNYYLLGGGDYSKYSKQFKVTPGVEDAILARGQGSWEGGTGRVDDVMSQGGIRMAVVPSALAYGNAGVSLYTAYRQGLRKAVPRDELLRYEIELLRCMEVELPVPSREENAGDSNSPRSVKACCTEDSFPCKMPETLN